MNKLVSIKVSLLLSFLSIAPKILHAQGSGTGGNTGGSGTGGTTGGPTGELDNPLGDKDLQTFFNEILDVVIILAIPVIVLFIILAGFTYVTAGGNETKIEKATKMFTWAVIGGVLILGAKVLTDVITGTIDAFR